MPEIGATDDEVVTIVEGLRKLPLKVNRRDGNISESDDDSTQCEKSMSFEEEKTDDKGTCTPQVRNGLG